MDNSQAQMLSSIGNQLKALRKKHYPSDTQSVFAQRIDVSRNTYRHMENGTGNVSFASYLKAAELYGTEQKLLSIFKTSSQINLFESLSDKNS